MTARGAHGAHKPKTAMRTTEQGLGILYESSEWSDFKLAAELSAQGCPVRLIDMERPDAVAAALRCNLLVSRVFASARARGHTRSHQHMTEIIKEAPQHGIDIINPGRAHGFEISKHASTQALTEAGLAVPRVLARSAPAALRAEHLDYPCVIKPDCGGRSTLTAVLHTETEAKHFLACAPADTTFIVEDFIEARAGYLTRIEIVAEHVAHINKRSIAAGGLSSYHVGSTYAPYPDCPDTVRAAAEMAAHALSFELGSFDVIETAEGTPVFIDANAVSNVSEDCDELLGFDLMAEHAAYIAERWRARNVCIPPPSRHT